MLQVNSVLSQDQHAPRSQAHRFAMEPTQSPLYTACPPPSPHASPVGSLVGCRPALSAPSALDPAPPAPAASRSAQDERKPFRFNAKAHSGGGRSASAGGRLASYSGGNAGQAKGKAAGGRGLRFNNVVVVGYTWSAGEYDRTSIEVSPLTIDDVNEIRRMRSEMWSQHARLRVTSSTATPGTSSPATTVDGNAAEKAGPGVPPSACRHGHFYTTCCDCRATLPC